MTRPKLRMSLIGAALAIAALPAAADVIERTTTYYYPTPVTTTDYYYVPSPATSDYYYAPQVVEVYEAPGVIVTAPYLNEDQAINYDVVDVIASNPRISGKIGVETRDRDVKLSGVVSTPGQARMAARDAQSVDGVRNVENQLRAKVGGSP